MSYRRKHVKSKIRELRPKKSIFKCLWFWMAILFILFLSAAVYFAIFYEKIQVREIQVYGNKKVKTAEIINLVSLDTNKSLIDFLFAKISSRSIFLADMNQISSDVLHKFPQVETATATKLFPNTVALDLSERKTFATFCDFMNKCFFIDRNGFAFEGADLQANYPKIFIVRQGKDEGVAANIGKFLLDKRMTDYIFQIKDGLSKNLKIDLRQVAISNNNLLEITTSEGWKAYFDGNEDIGSQITKLDLLINGQLSASSRQNLKYINLTPKDRAVVCDNDVCSGFGK